MYIYAQQDVKNYTVTEAWEPQPRIVTPAKANSDAPSDAMIIFDGKDLSNFTKLDGTPAAWSVSGGAFTVAKGTGDIKTKQTFGDVQLHIEWKSPDVVESEGQGRGNSGIFIQERYELQVLDNYNNKTYANGQAGSLYKQHPPLVNACRKPGEWQTYDIIFIAPRFNKDGRAIEPARITVLHNGVLIQNNTVLTGPTEFIGLPVYKPHDKAGIKLQDHGNAVSYRNIWVREL
ncbi:MAG: DUF1080 domain-containing protein [Cytophagales bacterium]|nr:DUF1080 domain-containing protein [Cytophagales bacterium]